MITRNSIPTALASVLLLIATMTGCAGGNPPPADATAPTATTVQPRLLIWPKLTNSDAAVGALVNGKLAANDVGCVTVGSAILMAPQDSSVSTDGSSINIAGRGEFRLGDQLPDLPGVFLDITGKGTDPTGITECRSITKPEHEYVVVASP